MPSLLLFIILLLSFALQAQDDYAKKSSFVDQITGTIHYAPQGGEVRGSPFLFEDWYPGVLVMRSGKELAEPFLKYEVYGHKLIVNRNDTAYELGNDVMEVRLFKGGKKSDTLLFQRGFTGLPKINKQSFVQVLTPGKLAFVKVHRSELDEVKEYNNANKILRFRTAHDYGISRYGVIETVHLGKTELLELAADKKGDVEALLTAKKINAKDEKGWSTAIAYLNTL